MTSNNHKTRMASAADAPAGLELDGEGNPIPFDRRTEDDKQKVRDAVAAGLHQDTAGSTKNPEHEAENPAPMPQGDQGRAVPRSKPHDPEGQQGSTQPGKIH
jgi:hypothetical protein